MKLETIRDQKVAEVIKKYEATITFSAMEKGRYNICFYNKGNGIEVVKLAIGHPNVDEKELVKDGKYT